MRDQSVLPKHRLVPMARVCAGNTSAGTQYPCCRIKALQTQTSESESQSASPRALVLLLLKTGLPVFGKPARPVLGQQYTTTMLKSQTHKAIHQPTKHQIYRQHYEFWARRLIATNPDQLSSKKSGPVSDKYLMPQTGSNVPPSTTRPFYLAMAVAALCYCGYRLRYL